MVTDRQLFNVHLRGIVCPFCFCILISKLHHFVTVSLNIIFDDLWLLCPLILSCNIIINVKNWNWYWCHKRQAILCTHIIFIITPQSYKKFWWAVLAHKWHLGGIPDQSLNLTDDWNVSKQSVECFWKN